MRIEEIKSYSNNITCHKCQTLIDGWEVHVDMAGNKHYFCPVCGDEK